MPSSKKAKKAAEPVPPPVESDDDDDDDDDDEQPTRRAEVEEVDEAPADGESNAARLRRLRRSRINERRKAKQNGFRSYAEMTGSGVGKNSYGNDLLTAALSQSDIKRLATWAPCAGDVSMKLADFETHLGLRDESLSSGPLKVLGANVEGFARKVLNEAVLRNVETGTGATITAANLKSVLRPFVGALNSEDFLAPGGVVRTAQQTPQKVTTTDDAGRRIVTEGDDFLLPTGEDEDAAIAEERKFAKLNHIKLLKEADKRRETAMSERKRKRSDKAAAAAAATPLATGSA
jgi:hypothetical protein